MASWSFWKKNERHNIQSNAASGLPNSDIRPSSRLSRPKQPDAQSELNDVLNDKPRIDENARRISKLVPALSNEQAVKASLGIRVKLISAMLEGWERPSWEKNVCDMLLNSPPLRFTYDEALACVRLVENDLRRKWDWPIEIADDQIVNSYSVLINADTATINWTLIRGGNVLPVAGGVLTSIFLLANQEGWNAQSLFVSTGGPVKNLQLKNCDISDSEARNLGRLLSAKLHSTTPQENSKELQSVQELADFFSGGQFSLRKN